MEFFTSFANIGMFSTLFVSMIIIRCILYFLYDYFLGPLCNKMDFKAKGRWACKYNLFQLLSLVNF